MANITILRPRFVEPRPTYSQDCQGRQRLENPFRNRGQAVVGDIPFLGQPETYGRVPEERGVEKTAVALRSKGGDWKHWVNANGAVR